MTAAAAPRLLLLGAPQLVRAESSLPLPDTLQGYLVAYLAHRSEWIEREQLATLLWPEAASEEAHHHLRVNLSRMRPLLRQCGVEAQLHAERRRVRLDLDTDTAALRAALAAGAWSGAADLPRGPFLQGLSFRAFEVLGEWARAERVALLGQWRKAILAAAPPLAPMAATALAARFLAHEPLDEEMLRVLLGALAALGRADEVQRTFEQFSARVAAELGVGPSPALVTFVQGLAAAPSSGREVSFEDDALIGREGAQLALGEALRRRRLAVVVGLGGVGKTRLAREAARSGAASFAAGVWWVNAAELSGPSELPRRLADLAGLPGGGGADPVQALAGHFGTRAALLVLDNTEAVLDERAALQAMLRSLLERCASLTVLATSREPIGLDDEHPLRLEGLELPGDDPARALESPAVRLFVAQARRFRPSFDPRAARADLAEIARLTGGLPLAILLAAAWLRMLGCAQIVEELRKGLAALDAGDGRSVRATLAGSWVRLERAEQQALARLAVFAGEFDSDAAARVAEAGLPVLASLLERSMVSGLGAAERARFDLHPLVRQFALEALERDPQAARATRERHAVLMAQRLAALHEGGRDAPKDALARIGRMHADAAAAWRWAAESARADLLLQIVPALGRFYETKGRLDEGIERCAAAEAQLDPQDRQELAALAALRRVRGTLLYRKSDYDAAEAVLLDALTAARAIGHRVGIEACLNVLGLALWMQGRYAQARGRVEEAQALAEGAGDRRSDAKLSATLGLINKAQGDFAGAEAQWRRALELDRVLGDWEGAANMLNNLGNLKRAQRRLDEAQELLEEGLRVCDEHGFAAARSFQLINLALVHLDAGRTGPARSFADLALASAVRSDERTIVAACHLVLAILELGAGDLAGAAAHYAQALQLTRALGDIQNQLEALDGFGRWLAARGDRERAVALWCAIARHPKVQAELLAEIDKRWTELGVDAEARERAGRQADAIDLVVATQGAIDELSSFRQESGPGAAGVGAG